MLAQTVFGLGINVSSTRLILSQGTRFDGRMVKAFATFVVGSGGLEGLLIGFVIFIILIAVQAMVMTKGATRVAEVAARFTLDAMPMKQAAVEAEYNAGAITEEEGFYFVYAKIHHEAYIKKEVKLGLNNGEIVEILSGIVEGDEIVTKGAILVKLASQAGSVPGHSHEH